MEERKAREWEVGVYGVLEVGGGVLCCGSGLGG